MKKPISLVVTDAGPLITLALAEELDVLLVKPEIEVVIPDLVRFEVLRHIDKPGARAISDWIRAHEPDRVRVASTEEYEEFMLLLSVKPDARTKSRGEAAAAEVIRRELGRDNDRVGILLFEDGDLRANRYVVTMPDNVLMLSTAQFLIGLEKSQVIPSAEAILDRVLTARGDAVKEPHQHVTPGAETRADDWSEDFKP